MRPSPRAAALAALALPPFLLPLYNPDLFWHLSAGAWLFERGSLPARDFLSFTQDGAPWLNFEWLAQAVFYAAHAAAGLTGLWALKAALLAATAALFVRVLVAGGVAGAGAAAALVLWAVGMFPHADIRPDLFSSLFFTAQLALLEACRRGRRLGAADYAGGFALFVLWANTHAAFSFGLALTLCYLAAALIAARSGTEADRQRPGELAALLGLQAVATLCQPYGLGPYRVMLEHWGQRAELSRYIQEWQPLRLDQPSHMPFWPLLAAALGLMLARARSRKFPAAPALAAAVFAFLALGHRRLAVFAVPLLVLTIFLLGKELQARLPRRAATAFAAAVAAFWLWVMVPVARSATRRGAFDYQHAPYHAAEFLARERGAFEGLRVYNPWEWGGYLGWRLRPWHKVFVDGRYLFHGIFPEIAEASLSAENCGAFMARHGIDAALLHNRGSRWKTTRVYPDKTTREFERPWYLFYFPRERWALAYWDKQSMLFVRRDRVAPRWLADMEYRYWRPDDGEALDDAVTRGEIPLERLEREKARQRSESGQM